PQPTYDENSNIKVINSQYIRNEFIDYENAKTGYGKIVPREAVLVNSTGVGTLGRVNINLLNFDFSLDNHINVIVVDKRIDILPCFLMIFLQTKFGQFQIEKYHSGSSGQIEIYPKDFDNFLIPLFPLEFQQQIEQMVRESHACLEQSKDLYREAEVLLYRELGLDPENPLASIEPHSGSLNISVRPLSQSLNATGRLDSEYYQQKYDEIEKVIKNYRGGYVKIGDCFNQNKTTGNFILSKYNYIEIGDINIGTATADYHLIPTDELPANAKIFLCNGDLLVSKVRPNRGAVAIVNIDESNFIASGAFTVLQEKNEIKKEVLMILLRTPLYKEWLLKFNVGTSYPVIKDEDILNLIIPKIAQQTQTQIAEKIKQSFTLRQKASELLQTAKQSVENAIEKG
ncbi:MAG: restriction endonuclease subunit S, partial [Neisseriaceae bacterium]|nr:restriction endonuclease subunit S [Neisseriaceae bacterium]